MESGAKDDKSVIAHLDLEKVSLSEGKLIGVQEQLASLKESRDYLFGDPKRVFITDPPNPPPGDPKLQGTWQAKYDEAKKSGNNREVIKVKQAAYAEGVIIN